jgi:hypothetical protein
MTEPELRPHIPAHASGEPPRRPTTAQILAVTIGTLLVLLALCAGAIKLLVGEPAEAAPSDRPAVVTPYPTPMPGPTGGVR